MGLIIVGVMGAGYYFKIYKKNEEASFEDEQDYNELEDDYESEGRIMILKIRKIQKLFQMKMNFNLLNDLSGRLRTTINSIIV